MYWRLLFTFVVCCLLSAGCMPAYPSIQIITERLYLPLPQGGWLHLLHKCLKAKQRYGPNEIILFLEPYSIPTAQAFDVPGCSWMEAYAKQGYDVWALDFRGFGHSSCPGALLQPAFSNPPAVHLADGVQDTAYAIRHILQHRQVKQINLVGWSWGAVVASAYANQQPEKINRLVLYGYMHGFNLPKMASLWAAKEAGLYPSAKLPAYQTASWEQAMHHWHLMLGPHQDQVLPSAMQRVGEVFLASEPSSWHRSRGLVRRPVGPLVGLFYIWTNRPLTQLDRITCPVLIIYGDQDWFAERGVVNKFVSSKYKKEICLPKATHWVLYERGHKELLAKVREFLAD